MDFRSRILNSELFGKYKPDFSYYLVPLQDYSNEELLEHGDEISLVMLLNKLRSPEDIQAFKEIPPERVSKILRDTPEHQVKLIADILQAFLTKLNVPDGETQELVGKVRKKKMAELFGSMEKMDIQAERRKTQEAEEKAKRAIEEGIEGIVEAFQSLGGSKEAAVGKVRERFQLSLKEAEEKVNLYWKEQ